MYRLNRILPFIITLFICNVIPNHLYAQLIILKPGGKTLYSGKKNTSLETTIRKKFLQNGTADTLSNQPLEFNTLFKAGGQDVLAGWFVCPADLKIKACGYDCGENPAGINAELKIVKMSSEWTIDMLNKYGSEQLGYWHGEDSSILPFMAGTPGTKKWITASESTSPFGEDLWSDEGIGAPSNPEDDGNRDTYQWIEMNILGQEPELKKGDIFAVCIKNTEPAESENNFAILSTNEPGYGMMKFYADGRTPGDALSAGWWKREYMLNLAVAVELTGDYPPVIAEVEKLETTVLTSERKISARIVDENPSGGPSGVEYAAVQYFLNNDSTWIDIAMTDLGDGRFQGVIPGHSSGTKVTYRIIARDVLSNVTVSEEINSYLIFNPSSGVKSLLVLNGYNYSSPDQKPEVKYFGTEDSEYEWRHDEWFYGELTEELVNHYDNIIEITNSDYGANGIVFNNEVIRQWLSSGSTRNYALIGQERLGANYNYEDRDFEPGSFEFDILGIKHLYNDVADTLDTRKPSRLLAEHGSLLCGKLFNEFFASGADSLNYDPGFEIGTSNWIDAFDVISGQEVDMRVETRNINRETVKENLACISHRITESGNKIAFIGLDPLGINTSPHSGKYKHYGLSLASPQTHVLQWFNVQTVVEFPENTLAKFNLCQNYPNPFNPESKINFSIGHESFVTLKVFNLLGEEVSTLVNETKPAGSYSLNFNAEHLTSGVYYYVLSAPGFSASRKMLLIK